MLRATIILLFSALAMAQRPVPDPKSTCRRFGKEMKLPPGLPEGSGLAAWKGKLWAINDSGRPAIFCLDTATASVTDIYDLPLHDRDWEDLAQDDDFFYLCDTGNNTGDVRHLHIYRIGKKSLEARKPVIDTIEFQWPKTEVLNRKKRLNFDCEAVVAIGDSLYLFTKEWKRTRQTRMFSLPKKPGSYTAAYRATLTTKVLVTGAGFEPKTGTLSLCGYNLALRPFVFVIPDFDPAEPFGKNMKKVAVKRQFRQTEGIATFDGTRFFIINERFSFWFVRAVARLNDIVIR